MHYQSDGEDQWADVFEPESQNGHYRHHPHQNTTPTAELPSQHKDALMGALRGLAQSTSRDPECPEDSPLHDMPVLVIRTPEDLERLQVQDAMARHTHKMCERQCASDFLTSMLYPMPEGMFYRYSQLNHIFKLILYANEQIPQSAVDDGARLTDADIELLGILCLPDWWEEIGEKGPNWWRAIRQDGAVSMAEALPRAWDAYQSSGPELEHVTLPFPCPFKKMSEDGLILWCICFVTTVTDWYFGRDPGGRPAVLDRVMQELIFFRGNVPGCPDAIAAMFDNAVCNGKVGPKGFLNPVESVYQSYHMLIDISPLPRPEDQALAPSQHH